MDGAYFSFITIASVGFGDMIPGIPANGNLPPDVQIKLLATAVDMVIGMAFLSMAFQLIQSEMDIKFKKFSNLQKRELDVAGEERNTLEAPGMCAPGI